MEPALIVDDLEIDWQSEEPLGENMKKIVIEFKKAWGLDPLKLIIHGPPAVGKTRLAKRIADHYNVLYISVQTLIANTIIELQEKIEIKRAQIKAAEEKQYLMEASPEEVDDEEAEEEEEDEGDIDDWLEQLEDIKTAIAESADGRLPDEHVIRLMKKTLASNECQNQGYVIDGYPKTYAHTKALFSGGGGAGDAEEEEAEEEEEGGGEPAGKKILPGIIIALEATDEFICERMMQRSEEEIQGTHYTEEHMLRRLAAFRAVNTEDTTLLNYFDEIEIHPVVINVMGDKSEGMDEIFNTVKDYIGEPIGFGLTPEEEAELKRISDDKIEQAAREARRLQIELEKRAAQDYENKMEKWNELTENFQQEEEKLFIAQAEPLRHYLTRFVFPTLTKGLLEVARIKPSDPVDFLAEYLFKENPEGKMFDPSYTRTAESLENKFKKRDHTKISR